ncbi:MAG: hypothetical protein IT215_01125 [Chitinophagaceae bacterium]|nr:hypothetical protein [Chitinophagaceae bacterium]
MNFTKYYNQEFSSRAFGAPIQTSRAEWESAPCPIDMTQVTNGQMQEFVEKFYMDDDGEICFDIAEKWLIENTKAKYIEDYSDNVKEDYRKRAQKLYYVRKGNYFFINN